MIDLAEYVDDTPVHFMTMLEPCDDRVILPERFNTSRQCVLKCLSALNFWMQEGDIGEIKLVKLNLPEGT